jgi:16S rRNA (cytosine967-C5)-methyltransferase
MPTKRASTRPRRGRPESTQNAHRRSAGPTAARLVAVRVLERVLRAGAFADLTLHHALAGGDLSGADRALATELVYGSLRWRGRLDYLLAHVLAKPLKKIEPLVLSNLRLGAYQIVFTDRIPVSAAVDQAVHCTRALGADRATGLVNAALRRLAREHEEIRFPSLVRAPKEHLIHFLSLPEWIAERWLALYGPEQAAALARVSNAPPPLTIRANTSKLKVDDLLAELRPRFPDAVRCRFAPSGITLGRSGDPGRDPAFLAGNFTVQDEASQLVVDLLDPQPGEWILDACAAPGTKTTAIAERLAGEQRDGGVLALDRHAGRLGLVARGARRLGLNRILTLERDASQPLRDLPELRLAGSNDSGSEPSSGRAPSDFDRILVDAPCTGLGTLRRHPDARWRVRAEDSLELRTLQLAILQRTADLLRPGGILVYSTCTLLPEENEELVRAFVGSRSDLRVARPEDAPKHLAPLLDAEGFMRCLPHIHDMDGFFAARLERIQ